MFKIWLVPLTLLLVVSLVALGCPAPAPVAPTVKLDRIEVGAILPLDKDFPKDSARIRAFMDVAPVFNITNPNDFPIMLDEIMFTLAFEAAPGTLLELHTPFYYQDMWIPAKMTNQLRVEALFDSHCVLSATLGSHGHTITPLGLKAPDLVRKWWAEIAEFKYVIEVRGGVATFVTPDGKIIRSNFSGKWGGKK